LRLSFFVIPSAARDLLWPLPLLFAVAPAQAGVQPVAALPVFIPSVERELLSLG